MGRCYTCCQENCGFRDCTCECHERTTVNKDIPELRPSLVAMAVGKPAPEVQETLREEKYIGSQDSLSAGEDPPRLRADLVAAAVGKPEEEIIRLQEAAVKNGELYPNGKAVKLTGDKDFDEMFSNCIATLATKGEEYTVGSKDRLANFKRSADKLRRPGVDIQMQDVWLIFFDKHWSAIQNYLKNDCHVKSNEPIQGRIMDCIVYLILFSKMVKEIEINRKEPTLPAIPVV